MLGLNGELISNYLDGYQLTGNEKYRHAAELTISYLDRFLRGPDGWGFANSQQGSTRADGKLLDAKEYFGLTDQARLRLGTPVIDKSMYTEPNCIAVRAYLKAQRVLGRRDCGEYAIRTLDQLLTLAKGEDSGLYHDPLRPTQSAFGLLSDQITCLQALLDAYETVGNKDFLAKARDVAGFVMRNLVDRDSGGVCYEMRSDGNVGLMAVKLKPYKMNCDAVVAFARLFYHTSEGEYKRTADRILKDLFDTPIRQDNLFLCNLATAYLWNNRAPLTYVVVGKPGEEYRSLLQAAWKTYVSRLVVLQFEPSVDKTQLGEMNFPITEKPSLYVCVDSLRSPAIDDTATVASRIKEFLRGK
jgi:uncharacterized protein YyaL (SSP411 family)